MKVRWWYVKAIAIITLSFAVIIGVRLFISNSFRRRDDYKVLVRIDAIRDDDVSEHYTLEAITIDGVSKVKTDFFQNTIYMLDGKTIFDVGGRYEFYESRVTFKNLLQILNRVKLGEVVTVNDKMRSYNPEISERTINDILNILLIDKQTSSKTSANYVFADDKIKNFSIYLVDIEGYKDMNIVMTFDRIVRKDEFDVPAFYQDIMEKIKFGDIAMIK